MSSHSNDGDGDTAGNLMKVDESDHSANEKRSVSGGSIPQINHTFGYFTKVGGYASLNENQVALAESTCSSIFPGKRSNASILNIVDLSAIGLERASTAREAVQIMGSLAEKYGYYDAGESLLVSDPEDAWIFHISPDDTQESAIWVAQHVPSDHIAVVANMFVIREIYLNSSDFMYSSVRCFFRVCLKFVTLTQTSTEPSGRSRESDILDAKSENIGFHCFVLRT